MSKFGFSEHTHIDDRDDNPGDSWLAGRSWLKVNIHLQTIYHRNKSSWCTRNYYRKHLAISRNKKELPKNSQCLWEMSQTLARIPKSRQKAQPNFSFKRVRLHVRLTDRTRPFKDPCFMHYHSLPFSCPQWLGFLFILFCFGFKVIFSTLKSSHQNDFQLVNGVTGKGNYKRVSKVLRMLRYNSNHGLGHWLWR